MTLLDLLAGAAAVLALEGIIAAAFPDAMRRAWAGLAAMPSDGVRRGGVVAAAIGVGVAWLAVGSP